ncbi:class I SAM-dependent methyltransferase [Patescibacteria group bacterium]|nr:class I SAM-dependent methyltransferase [Patescibacteria group bacterium]
MAQIARPASYYDVLYQRAVEEQGEGLAWIQERDAAVMPHIVGSVLDLGCGLGTIADQIDSAEYLGADFSEFAIEHCGAKVRNPHARFEVVDLRIWKPPSKFDTVLLLEVLEHVKEPESIAKLALECARKRVIVTVPRDMLGRAHVWPTWTQTDLENILDKLSTCRLFGGEEGDRWWLAIREIVE